MGLRKFKHPLTLASIVIIVLIVSWIRDYQSITRFPKYAIGTTVQRGDFGSIEYEFIADGEKVTGSLSKYNLPLKRNVKIPGGKYLVIYSTKRPEISILLINRPVLDSIDVDSLLSLPISKNEIRWYKL